MEIEAIYITGIVTTFIFGLVIIELLKLMGLITIIDVGTEKMTGKDKAWGVIVELIVAAAAGIAWILTIVSCISCLIFMLTGGEE